jgi:glycosyltransferase
MKVSVITVTFNSAPTIADTLASVASQSHPDIEHLVIDGASSDDTVAIAKRAGTRVACIVSEPDRGIYDAMNKGLALATGDLIGFLNGDDVFASDDSVRLLVAAVTETNADAAYGDLVYVRENDLSVVVRQWHAGAYSPSRLRFGWMPPHPTFYIRRKTLADVGAFDTSFRIAADYDFILRCLGRSGTVVAYVPRVLIHMRTGGASNRSASAMWRKSTEDLRALRRSGTGGIGTLLCKNFRKLPQFLRRPSTV